MTLRFLSWETGWVDMSLVKIGNICGGKQGFRGISNSVLDMMDF